MVRRRRLPPRLALGADARLRDVRRIPDPRVLGRVHGARGGLRPLLRVPESLHVRDARAGPRRQLPDALRRMGRGGPVLLPAHRLLLRQEVRRRRGQEGLRHESDRGLRVHPRHLRRVRPLRLGRLRPGLRDGGREPRGLHALPDARVPAALRRRLRKIGAVSPVRLAAGRDGRTDSGLRAHPCGHDGHGRRLHGRPLQRVLPPRAARHDRRGGRRRLHGSLCRNDRRRAERHQEGAGLFDRVAARVHVPRVRRRGLHRGHVPRHDACVLQGLPLPRRRIGDPRDGRGAGHPPHGRPGEEDPEDLLDVPDREHDDRGCAVPRGLLLQGRDQGRRLPRRVRGGPLASEGALRRRALHGRASRRSTCSAWSA